MRGAIKYEETIGGVLGCFYLISSNRTRQDFTASSKSRRALFSTTTG
jgi:hypothetical protein